MAGRKGSAAMTAEEFAVEWAYLLGNLNNRPRGEDEQTRYIAYWDKLRHLTAEKFRQAVDEYIESDVRWNFPTWGDILAIARRRMLESQESTERLSEHPAAYIAKGADPEFFQSEEWLTLCETLDVKPEIASVNWQEAVSDRQRRHLTAKRMGQAMRGSAA